LQIVAARQHRLLPRREQCYVACLALNPGFTLRRYRAGAQSDNPVFLKLRERFIEDMRRAGVPEG
jgi:hypothetical protein